MDVYSDLIYQTFIIFLSLVRFIPNFCHSVSLMYLLSFLKSNGIVTRVGFPFNRKDTMSLLQPTSNAVELCKEL